MKENQAIPQFGNIEDGVEYQLRAGGYLVVNNDQGHIAVVRSKNGYFLPGGGLEDTENPEEAAIFHQRNDLIRRVLAELSDRDQEILTRFYLQEQGQDQICDEMSLSETQFRLLKSRAKARFGELGRKKLAHRNLQAVFLRTSVGLSH